VLQRLGVRAKAAYVAPAVVAWAWYLRAGVHPTIAGVIVGLVDACAGVARTGRISRRGQKEVEYLARTTPSALSAHELAETFGHVDVARAVKRRPPPTASSKPSTLWVAFGIMPVFALANAGVPLSGSVLVLPSSFRVTAAVAVALIVAQTARHTSSRSG
jgi:NhaA family Na+:H+ antiporter